MDGTAKTTALVTGATSGIGFETARQLCRRNVRVIVACRDVDKGRKAVESIQKDWKDADVELGPVLDLSSSSSVRSFVKDLRPGPIHILVNNAGMNNAGGKMAISGEGRKMREIVQVNYLGPYLLTRLLEDRMKAPKGVGGISSRIVNVSSVMHRLTKYRDADSFLYGDSSYADTKFANVLFTHELEERLGDAWGIHAVAVDPGSVVSGIWRDSMWENSWILKLLFAPASDGAAAVVHAATVDFDRENDVIIKKKNTTSSKSKSSLHPPFRFYARGAFTWPALTHMPNTMRVNSHHGESTGIVPILKTWTRTLMAINGILHASIDWPLRIFAKTIIPVFSHSICAKTSPVRANLAAYDRDLARELWNASAKACGLPP